MIAMVLGNVSKVDVYPDKKTGELVRTAYVATGEHMIPVRLKPDQDFRKLTAVVVCGELKAFERRYYINGGSIRLATQDDLAMFNEAEDSALEAAQGGSLVASGSSTDLASASKG